MVTPRCVRPLVAFSPDCWPSGWPSSARSLAFAVLRGDRAARRRLRHRRPPVHHRVGLFRATPPLGVVRKLRGERDIGPTLVRQRVRGSRPDLLEARAAHRLVARPVSRGVLQASSRRRSIASSRSPTPTSSAPSPSSCARAPTSSSPVDRRRSRWRRRRSRRCTPPGCPTGATSSSRSSGRTSSGASRPTSASCASWAQLISLFPTVELANPVGIIDDFDHTIARSSTSARSGEHGRVQPHHGGARPRRRARAAHRPRADHAPRDHHGALLRRARRRRRDACARAPRTPRASWSTACAAGSSR